MNETPRLLGGRYEVGELLGRGGMAEVHLGRDARLGRTVAIKLLRADLARDATFQARFQREAQSSAGLNHPSIVSVYDTGEEVYPDATGGSLTIPYIVMEYIQGRTLRAMLQNNHPLPVATALTITGGVLGALEYSHRAGIVHRDIKPANVMVTPTGDVKVMDFGIARAIADANTNMTATQAVIGTAQYLSPEQARGETVDTRSDLYSAGCLLFELMTGRPPFIGDSPVAVAYQHVRERPLSPSTFNPQIPDIVDQLVLHSLEKERDGRYQTAAEFRADVDAARTGRPLSISARLSSPTAATEHLGPGYAGATQVVTPPPTGQYYSHDAAPGTSAVPASGVDSLLGPPGYPNGQGYAGGPGYPNGQGHAAGPGDLGTRRDAKAKQDSAQMQYGLLVLAVILVFSLVGFGAWKIIGSMAGAKQTSMLAVVDKMKEDAVSDLVKDGFTEANITVTEVANDAPAGTVTDQTPTAGTMVVAATQPVQLTVSSGSASVKVPDVKGDSQADASSALLENGLTVSTTVKSEDSGSYPVGTVIRTVPAADKTVDRGTEVTLYIASGNVTVPDVTGESRAKAETDLVGLTVVIAKRQYSDTVAVGRVISQSIPKDTSVKQGTSITIVLSKGPEPTATATPTTDPTTTDPTTDPTTTDPTATTTM